MRPLLCFATLLSVAALVFAQTPKDQLIKPPADARHYVIESIGGKHGDSWIWKAADGGYLGRESMNLRGQVWEVDGGGKAGPGGAPQSMMIRGVTPSGDAGETYTSSGGSADWKSPIDSGSTKMRLAALSSSWRSGSHKRLFPCHAAGYASHSLKLLPGGEVHASKLTTIEVGQSANRRTITLWQITGLNLG